MSNNVFTFRIYLPSLEKYAYFKELKSIQYLTLCKLIQNDDNKPVDDLFTSIIHESIDNTDILPLLTRIDKFCILLNIRIMSISDTLELSFKPTGSDEKLNIKCDLYDVLDKVTNFKFEYNKLVQVSDKYSIGTSIPNTLTDLENTNILNDSLCSIRINDKIYDLTEYDTESKNKVIDSLSSGVLSQLNRSLKASNDEYNIEILSYDNPNTSVPDGQNKYTLQLYNNSIFEFTKLIFNGNIEEQYYLRYILAKRLHFQVDYIDNKSPIDLTTYINFYKKELADEKKAADKQNRQNSMNLPAQNFGGGVA